jgi:acyl-CoA thioesterase I
VALCVTSFPKIKQKLITNKKKCPFHNGKVNKIKTIVLISFFLNYCQQISAQQIADEHYLDSIKVDFQKKWPKNRTINLVFHGHSVVVGYFKTPEVRTLEAYPFLTLKNVKEIYPIAILNSITTAIGGENAEQGAKRFKSEVLSHRPDVLFIDYALNDRNIGLERAKVAWSQMIKEAKENGTKLILFTPTPDLKENILDNETMLAKHAEQIKELAKTYQVGLIDSYEIFKNIAQTESLEKYMAQNNHINELGHQLVAKEIMKYFK